MKTIEQWKKEIKAIKLNHKDIERCLEATLKKIELLESIYQSGGYHFSDKLKDAAIEERRRLCQLSSACYSLLKHKVVAQNGTH